MACLDPSLRSEISDLIVAYDPATLARRPVAKADVVAKLRREGNRRAARIAAGLPDRNGILDGEAIDRLLVRVHAELQRLSEEFQQGRRVARLLGPLLEAVRARGMRPLRVVDVGCGLGYLVRWLAARGGLGDDVELVGCDYNAALVAEAERAAADEGLRCRFVVGNAFTLSEPATIYLSSGVLHHFRGDDLVAFFRRQAQPGTEAFLHYDIAPTWLSVIGAWIFHVARMREPLSQHDGLLSAVRAHASAALTEAARRGADGFDVAIVDEPPRMLPVVDVMRPVVGVRSKLRADVSVAWASRRVTWAA